jgi:hypothetical protein
VQAIDGIEFWLLTVLEWGVRLFAIYGLGDCLIRKAAAFPAAGKLTKPAWLLLTAVAVAMSVRPGIGILAMIGLVITSVYLADVRPAVREISGPSRW